MATSKPSENQQGSLPKNTPPVVSSQEWEAARQQLLVKEKAFTRSRDALAAQIKGASSRQSAGRRPG